MAIQDTVAEDNNLPGQLGTIRGQLPAWQRSKAAVGEAAIAGILEQSTHLRKRDLQQMIVQSVDEVSPVT